MPNGVAVIGKMLTTEEKNGKVGEAEQVPDVRSESGDAVRGRPN